MSFEEMRARRTNRVKRGLTILQKPLNDLEKPDHEIDTLEIGQKSEFGPRLSTRISYGCARIIEFAFRLEIHML